MKITLFLICSSLLLSVSPPKRPKLPKDILGLWGWQIHFSLETRNQPMPYGKTKDQESAHYEFKKNGEVIRYGMFVLCGNDRDEKTVSKGSWIPMSDSTLRLTFKYEEEEMSQVCWLYRNKENDLEMRMYPISK